MAYDLDASSVVAIVGMAGRFPGARNLAEFWLNLRAGVESVRFLSGEEMAALGVTPGLAADPAWVPAVAMPEGIEEFDAPFFGVSHREAEILDPQHRLFLETCWAALEDAGYSPDSPEPLTAVFGGATTSTYLLFNLARNPQLVAAVDPLQLIVGNAVDSLTTRVSYKLNLKGASQAVQCACSTSLVAVHLACQSLLDMESDVALAGGVSINVGQRAGYRFQEDSILAPDGHCRAFDAGARGTIFGGGVGVVVLKRLDDALAAGDTIRAVVRGSAVNNDGAAKVGYTAPSVEGQAAVVAEALGASGVDAGTIGYIEAHGTGTALGDPIEIQALARAYGSFTPKRGFAALGTVKSNIGHLDIASGIAGLIKTVLALEHAEIPPSLHFETPNPRIDFAASPVYVNRELAVWPQGAGPRRAAVSSFGFGGTNAHVILEEAPARPPRPGTAEPARHLLILSAKTEPALAAAARNLAEHFREHPETDLGDAAFTLLAGRQAFAHRRAVVCHDVADAAARLAEPAESPAGMGPLAEAGRRWLAGEPLDAAELFAGGKRRRIPLPTYPFERHRYWIEPAGIVASGPPAATAPSLHARPPLATPYVAPRGEGEERVAAVWREVLGVAEVGVHDSFLELGGDSLLATRLMSRLREELAVDLSMDRLFAQPTVAAVAAAVVEARAGQAGDEELARLLAEIGGMSEDDLERELAAGDEEPRG
ncbi:MAG TPA: beta-ketoacyl synthase N-terminal-like domain-containing protein [Thermoanaerobaculia bacterium]|jgi:acyl transferase domain-containing protein